MPASTLVLSRFSTLHKFPASATFSSLTIDGSILVDHLVDAQLRDHLRDVCKNINSMTINFGGCGARTTGGVMDAFFEFMKTLRRLRRLEIRNFVLNDPDAPPSRPTCLDRSPLCVRRLTIAHTQSACLAYLMDYIEAHDVSLECCLWIEKLPSCSRLELVNIVPFEDIMEILLEWDGDELIIDSCPFVDEEFVYDLLQRMTAREKPVWPSARLSFEGYPYVIRRKLYEFLDVHSRLTKAPWGLARINSRRRLGVADKSLGFTFNYNGNAGKGVDIYIVDSGIRLTHEEFGGRAYWGETFGSLSDEDENGHGTHCAGTAAGKTYGVAKRARVYSVRVLNKSGEGPPSEFVTALGWIHEAVKKSKRPSVVSVSIRYDPSLMVDNAVRSLIEYGVHVVVSAGNKNKDAKTQSPARVKEAITVGATTIQDERWVSSNYGPLVDVFAPGYHILSAGITSDTATVFKDGTSMATPHVSGLVAALISIHGNETPAKMAQRVKDMSLKGILNPYTLPKGTTNRVIANNFNMQTVTYSK